MLNIGVQKRMTENHEYDTPEKGTSDWHTPLNSNFEKLDSDVEIRDNDAQLDSYQPKSGAKFFAIDTGNVYVGNGNEWSLAPVQAHDHERLSVDKSFQLPVRDSDPDSASNGELWFRRDSSELRIETQDGPQTLTVTDDTSTASDGDFDISEPFDDSSWTNTFGDEWDYGLDTNASINDISGRSGNQLQATIPGGTHRGIYTVHNHRTRSGSAPTKCYHKFNIRFEPGFTDRVRDDGKLPGFAGRDGTDEGAGGNPANGTGWSARMGFDDPSDYSGSGVRLDYYIYHMDASGSYGEHDFWGQLLEEGTWYEVEQYIDLGTPNTNDGVLRGWIDGNLQYERTDLRWRQSGGNDLQWSWWDFYHGGSATPTGDISVQFDDLFVKRDGMP